MSQLKRNPFSFLNTDSKFGLGILELGEKRLNQCLPRSQLRFLLETVSRKQGRDKPARQNKNQPNKREALPASVELEY